MNHARNIFFGLCVAFAASGALAFLLGLDLYLQEGRSMFASGAMTGGFTCIPLSLLGFLRFRNRFVGT